VIPSEQTVEHQVARDRRLSSRGLHRRLTLVLLVLVAALSPAFYSYGTSMLRPSSLPLGIRSLEWLRAHHMRWLVDTAEREYYRWNAPSKGGPPLQTLPALSAVRAAPAVSRRVHRPVAHAPYRPARIRAVLRPALPGEGAWQAAGPATHGPAPVLITEYRPEADYPRVVAYVAWIDHQRTQIGLYPGRYEPPSSSPRGPMMVPSGERWRLLATFNSGFTYRDGHGGFAVDGRSYTPLRRGFGTIVGYRDGSVDVLSWQGGPTPPSTVAFARQNLPLIVNHGIPSPNLSNGPEWGATLGNAILVWRSAVGIDRRGNLVYVAANDQTVRSLAEILVHVGAVRAIELDINAEWPSFIAYGHFGGNDPTKLVPNGMQPATRYLVPDDRDFFAIYRAVPGTRGSVPLR
jgi:phosphodiester glycosidase